MPLFSSGIVEIRTTARGFALVRIVPGRVLWRGGFGVPGLRRARGFRTEVARRDSRFPELAQARVRAGAGPGETIPIPGPGSAQPRVRKSQLPRKPEQSLLLLQT